MSSRNQRAIVAYYESVSGAAAIANSNVTGSARWVDFRETTFSSGAYVYSTTTNTAIVSVSIKDVIHEPKQATIRIKNRPAKPMVGNPATAGAQGPWTGSVTQFSKIRIMDGQTNQPYFYGIVYTIQETYDPRHGNVLVLSCHDMLKEVQDKTTVGHSGYFIPGVHDRLYQHYDRAATEVHTDKGIIGAPSTTVRTTLGSDSGDTTVNVENRTGFKKTDIIQITNSSDQSEQMTVTGVGGSATGPVLTVTRATASFSAGYSADGSATRYAFAVGDEITVVRGTNSTPPNSRGGVIKSLVVRNSNNIEVTSNTAASTDARFQDSVVKYNTSGKNDHLPIDSDTARSLLTIVQNLAVEDPHNGTATDERTSGYSYYASPNFLDATASNEIPKAFFNYFKNGTFPTTAATYGGSTTPSNGTFDQGLSIYFPSVATTASGSFSETGRLIPMTTYDLGRASGEIFTGAKIEFIEAVTPSEEDGEASVPVEKTANFMYLEATTIVNTGNLDKAFVFNGTSGTITPGGICLIDGTELNEHGFVDTSPGNNNESAEHLNVRLKQLNAAITDAAATTISVDSDARTAGFYVGQHILVDDGSNPEVMKITSLDHANNIGVERGQNGTTATTHDDNAHVLAYHVARIQYVGKEAALSGTYQNISSTGILLSHIDEHIIAGNADENFDEYWKVGGLSKTWVGDVSKSTMTLSYTPQNSFGFIRLGNYQWTKGILSSNTIREKVFGLLQRSSQETIRGWVATYRPPKYHFFDTIASLSGTSTQILNLSGTTNPITEGIKIGTTVNQLDSNDNLTGVYGYVEAIGVTEADRDVRVKWSSGSGISASDKVRFDVEVRAGDLIKVRNDLVNVDTVFTVTKTDYSEDDGVQLTTYNVVGMQDQKRGIGYKNLAAAKGGTGAGGGGLPSKVEPLTLGFKIRSTGIQALKWKGGNLGYKGKTYKISGGSVSSLDAGGTFVVYCTIGNSVLKVASKALYEQNIKHYYQSEIVTLATVTIDINTTDGEFAKVIMQSYVKGPEAVDQIPFSELVPSGELNFTTEASVDLTGGLNADLTKTASAITVTDDGVGAGEKPFWLGQTVLIDNEIIKIVSKASSTSFNVSRKTGVEHSSGANIFGNFRAGKIKPLEFDAGNFGLAFYTPSISNSNVFSYEQTLSIGKEIGTSFVNGGSLGAKADVQIFNGHLEMKSSTTGNYAITWVDSGGLNGSIVMSGGYLFLEEADVSDNYVGITSVHDPNTYIRWNDSDELAFYSGGYKSFYTKATSASNGTIYVEGAYSWIDDTDTYILASSDQMQFYSDGELAFYTEASSATNGTIYVEDKYSWIDDPDTYISAVSNQINFRTGTTLAARMDSSQNFRVETTGAFIYSKEGYTFVDDDNTYITAGSDKINFYTGGANLRVEIDSTGIRSEEGNNSTPGFSFVADPDTGMYRSGANQLGFSFGGTARIYMSNAGLGSASSGTADLLVTGKGEFGGDVYSGGSVLSSDKTYKTNIVDNPYGLNVIDQLKPKQYTFKRDKSERLGLIAQDVKEILPDLDVVVGKEGSYSMRYESFIPILIKSIQELKKEIDKLKENK